MSPVVVVVGQTTSPLLPLLLLPVVGVYVSAHVGREKEHQALHDALTGLPNRTLFRGSAASGSAQSPARGPAAVLLIDLDRFKEVNDTLGHDTGDHAAGQQVGARSARRCASGDIVARLGGDEFAVFLPAVEDDAGRHRGGAAHPDAARASRSSSRTCPCSSRPASASPSCPEDGADVGTLLRRADVAMYLAKEHRTGVERYSADARPAQPVAACRLLGELRAAIDDRRARPALPAQGRARRRASSSASRRWCAGEHPTRGLLYPADFLPLAERSGLIGPISPTACSRRRVHQVGDVAGARGMQLPRRRQPVGPQPRRRDAACPHHRVCCSHCGVPARVADPRDHRESTVMADPEARAARAHAAVGAWACASPSTTSAPATRRSPTCAQLPISEIKIDRSFIAGILDSAERRHHRALAPSTWPTTSASRSSPRAWSRRPCASCWPSTAATSCRATSSAHRCPRPRSRR